MPRSPRSSIAALGALAIVLLLAAPSPGSISIGARADGLMTVSAPMASDSGAAAAPASSVSPPSVAPLGGLSPWVNLTQNLSTAPSPREGAMMTFDPAIGGVLLFGGLSRNRSLSDTWKFSAGHWTNLTGGLTVSPPARYKGGLTFDSADGYALLFGGSAGLTYRNDTWAFNATGWHLIPSPRAPTPREDVQMTYDIVDGYVLLFGGELISQAFTSDTWTYLGGLWSNRTGVVTGTPPARESGVVVYDRADQYVVMFSGKRNDTSMLQDTWSYRAGTWTNLSPTLSLQPPGRESSTMVYDSIDGLGLLVGGFRFPNSLSDEWTFSGGRWTQIFPASPPPVREDGALGYNPNGGFGYVLLFGGRTSPLANGTHLNDTWSFKIPISLVANATSPIDLTETTPIALAVSGGYPPLTVSWAGLPTGCSGGNVTAISCMPTAAGSYNVSASAVDASGGSAASNVVAIVVNADPVVNASASAYNGTAPLNVSFASVLTGGTGPFSYDWRFGDGGNASTPAPYHVYLTGSFRATLSVRDARGFLATTQLAPINVSGAAVPLSVTASGDQTSGVSPLTVHFSSAPSGGLPPYQFAWTFGPPGATGTGQNAMFTYSTPGTFLAQVTVNDSIAEQANATVTITVSAPPVLTASAAASPTSGVGPLNVQFTGSATGGVAPYAYTWQFGPTGASGSGSVASYTYPDPGTFSAVLTVTDATDHTATATVQIVVTPVFAANFSATAGQPYCSGGTGFAVLTVAATATGGTGGYGYVWTFPAGVQGPPTGAASGSAVVAAGGSYPISLNASDSSGAHLLVQQSVPTSSIGCLTSSSSSASVGEWVLWVLIALVAVLIAVEAFLLLRRQGS